MTLSYTQIVGTFTDGSGAPLSGSGQFFVNVPLYSAGVPVLQPNVPVPVEVVAGQLKNASGATLQLLDLGSTGLVIEGSQTGFWFWSVSLTIGGQTLPTWSFFLNHSSTPVDLFSLASTAAVSSLYVPLAGGTMTGPLALTGSPPLEIPSGAASGKVLTSDASGNASWQAASGGITPPAGDIGGTTSAPTVTGTHLASPLPLAQGGTGAATQQAAINALTGSQTAGRYLRSDGTNSALAAIQAADVPTLNQSTTGTAANVTGTVAIANGGTGQTAQQAAMDALAGSQASGQYLRGNGTHVQMSAIQAADVPQLSQYNPIGLTGAQAATSYAGGTVSGHPLSGTWSQGQWVADQSGKMYICVTGGTPGTWRRVGAMPYQFFLDDYCKADGRQALVTVSNGSATISTTPLAAPSAPSPTTATTGGTVAAGTYQVKITYTNRWGETVASSAGSVTTTGSTSTITIPSPAVSGNATGWYAYVTQAGGNTYTRQQAAGSPSVLGVSLVLTAPPSSGGANPPGADSSAAQVFAAGDVGKNVMICGGLGSPGAPWVDTIAVYHSPTSVDLSTAGAAVNQAACPMVFSSDDRLAADQCRADALAYALANGNFCQVIATDRNYGMGSGFFQSTAATGGTQYNTQFRIPVGNPSGATEQLEFQLLGPADNAHCEFWESQLPSLGAATFISYSLGPTTADPTYGQQSVIGGPTGSGAQVGGFANVTAVIKGIQVVQPGFSNTLGIDLTWVKGCVLRGSSKAYAPSTSSGGGVNPSSAWISNSFFQSKIGAGVRLPATGNNDDIAVESFTCEGLTSGVISGADHAVIGRLATINCYIPLRLDFTVGLGGTPHDLTITQWSCENCGAGIQVNGGGPCTVNIQMDGENTSLAYDISDSSNALNGRVLWNDTFRTAGGPANVVAPTVVGAANLEIINGSLARAVQGAPTYTLGTAFQNPWWRHTTVELAGGTVTGVKTGPTQASLTISPRTSGQFRLPSGWWMEIDGSVKPTTFTATPD